jgi:hypothetical protein
LRTKVFEIYDLLGTSGKFVVRGGGGMLYELIDGQHFPNTWDGSPPVAAP